MAKEKWIKITEEITDGPKFMDLIMESIKEAARQGIKAGSIVINRNMVFVPELFGERPAMVCGLNAYLTKDELPDMYSFAVLESQRKKTNTNADRIRAMSDEELAEWIHDGISSDACDYCEYNNGYCDGSPCRGKTEAEIITDWLKQPAVE